MRIHELSIDRFGAWFGVNVGEFSDDLNVLFVPEVERRGALWSFLSAVLFGFTDETRRRYSPADNGAAGGVLHITTRHGRHSVSRHDHDLRRGTLTVRDASGALCDDRDLHGLLGDVDEATFHSAFTLGREAWDNGGWLDDGALAQRFGEVTSPARRPALDAALAEMVEIRHAASGRGGEPTLDELATRCEELRREIDAEVASERQRFAACFTQWSQGRQEAQRVAEELERKLADLQRQLEENTAALAAAQCACATRAQPPCPAGN